MFSFIPIPLNFFRLSYSLFSLFSVSIIVGPLSSLTRAVYRLPCMSHLYLYFQFSFIELYIILLLPSLHTSFYFHFISIFLFFPILIAHIAFPAYFYASSFPCPLSRLPESYILFLFAPCSLSTLQSFPVLPSCSPVRPAFIPNRPVPRALRRHHPHHRVNHLSKGNPISSRTFILKPVYS